MTKNYIRLKSELYNYYLKNGDIRKIGKNFLQKVEALLEESKQKKLIKPDLDVKKVAYTIYSLAAGVIIRQNIKSNEYKDMQELCSVIEDYIELLKR